MIEAQKRHMLFYLMMLSAFSVLGLSIIMPALPVIAQYFSRSSDEIWALATFFAAPGIISTPFAGIFADRFGRRTVLVPCLTLLFIGSLGCALAPTYELLLVFRVIQGLGSGPLSSLNATIVADIFAPAERPRALGALSISIALSTAVLPFVGGILTEWNWRLVFLLPTLSAPLVWWTMRLPLKAGNPDIQFSPYLQTCADFAKSRSAWKIFAQDFLLTACMFGPFATYLPIIEAELYGASSSNIGTITLFSAAGAVLGGIIAGWLAARLSLRVLLLLAALLMALSLLLVTVAPTLWFFILPMAVFGIGQNLMMPLIKTRISVLSTPQNVGAAMALNGMFFRISQAVSPAVCGLFWAAFGAHGPVWFGLIIALVMVALALLEPAAQLASDKGQR